MTTGARPSGRSALFGDPVTPGATTRPTAGSRALYSAAPAPGSWRVTVACSGCGARTPMAPADVARRLVHPAARWWPWQRHPHRLRCPACGALRWCRLSLPSRGRRR